MRIDQNDVFLLQQNDEIMKTINDLIDITKNMNRYEIETLIDIEITYELADRISLYPERRYAAMVKSLQSTLTWALCKIHELQAEHINEHPS